MVDILRVHTKDLVKDKFTLEQVGVYWDNLTCLQRVKLDYRKVLQLPDLAKDVYPYLSWEKLLDHVEDTRAYWQFVEAFGRVQVSNFKSEE